jgi:hypothetical protein
VDELAQPVGGVGDGADDGITVEVGHDPGCGQEPLPRPGEVSAASADVVVGPHSADIPS